MALLLSLKRTVDLEPGLTTPQVFHVSQNDVGTKLYVGLEQGGTAYTIPEGTTAKVQGCNALGEPFEAITATVSASEVYFTITDQDVTQFAGNAKCEVVLTNGSNILGTANFIVAVEASPMGSDVPAIYTNPVQAYIEGVVQDYVDDDVLPDITADIASKADASDVGDLTNLETTDKTSIVDAVNESVDDIKKSLSCKGIVSTTASGAVYTDLNDIKEYGMFAVSSNALNVPVAQHGTLLVMPIGSTDFSTGLYRYRKQQIFITGTSSGQNIYMRYMSNSTTWSPNWTRVIDTDLPDKLRFIQSKGLADSGLTESNFQSGGINSSGGNTTNANRIRTQGYFPVGDYDAMHYTIQTGYRLYVVFFSSNSASANIWHSEWVTDYGTFIFPDGTKYVRFQLASLGDATALATSDYTVATIQWGTRATDTTNPIVKKTKWLAIGDSITFGVYSIPDDGGKEVTCQYGWVHRLAASLDYDLTVMASRGIGYMERGDDPTNPDPNAPRIPLETLIGWAVALEGDFNLITLALGINDYNAGGKTLNGIEESLRDTIDSLVTRFPNSRLVVITPFNCTREGSVSTKYAYGAVHSPNNFTLKQLADRIVSVCESLSVETIYATDCFLFNMVNITGFLPDGVHPSYEAHTLIAKNMAHYLLN